MSIPIAERRQIENEMIFRTGNEKIGIALDEIDAMHVEDGDPELVRENDLSLQFMCECSDDNCDERITMNLSKYKKIHLNRDTFIIKLSHQVDDIEVVLLTNSTYSVVRKNNSTSDPEGGLNIIATNNV